MPVAITCEHCKATFSVIPARAASAKFCSVRCRADWRSGAWVGENHPRWTGGEREKACAHCGGAFSIRPKQPITTFRKQRFCSKTCADEGGLRYEGPEHPSWTGGGKRSGKQAAWARKVISRDGAACQHCGSRGAELHAHHVKSYKEHPSLRFEVANGITLCAPCHWAVHSASTANGVNSGNPHRHERAAGNPEPSRGRKVSEGATTRGRAYRRVEANCAECGAFISRRASDAVGRANLFCSKRCSSRFNRRAGKIGPRAHGSNASTSAPPERDDIV